MARHVLKESSGVLLTKVSLTDGSNGDEVDARYVVSNRQDLQPQDFGKLAEAMACFDVEVLKNK